MSMNPSMQPARDALSARQLPRFAAGLAGLAKDEIRKAKSLDLSKNYWAGRPPTNSRETRSVRQGQARSNSRTSAAPSARTVNDGSPLAAAPSPALRV